MFECLIVHLAKLDEILVSLKYLMLLEEKEAKVQEDKVHQSQLVQIKLLQVEAGKVQKAKEGHQPKNLKVEHGVQI